MKNSLNQLSYTKEENPRFLT